MKMEPFDRKYEWKAVTLLSLVFGLVGLDRWIISPLPPAMVKDLHLNYQDVGYIFGVLGILWGLFAILTGNLSDKFGHRKILIPAIIFFSLLSGFSGMAGGLVSLIVIRALMGATEGAFCPTSFAATAAAAKPSRRGLMQGIQQSGFPLFGLALGPFIATQLLKVVPSWREVFWVVAVPGIVVGVCMYLVLKDPGKLTHNEYPQNNQSNRSDWLKVLKTRNVVICMLVLCCSMACIFVLSAMVPLYLENYIHLNAQQMGFVMSSIGFGGFVGQFALPGMSDIFGRKKVAVISFIAASLFVIFFSHTGSNSFGLFINLFFISLCCLGSIGLITGRIAAESAPIGMVATAIGLVVGAGEIFGGGVAPLIGGYIAKNFGIQNILYLALSGVILGDVCSLFLRETAPAVVAGIKEVNHAPG
jgi:MFS family permease